MGAIEIDNVGQRAQARFVEQTTDKFQADERCADDGQDAVSKASAADVGAKAVIDGRLTALKAQKLPLVVFTQVFFPGPHVDVTTEWIDPNEGGVQIKRFKSLGGANERTAGHAAEFEPELRLDHSGDVIDHKILYVGVRITCVCFNGIDIVEGVIARP